MSHTGIITHTLHNIKHSIKNPLGRIFNSFAELKLSLFILCTSGLECMIHVLKNSGY